MSTRLEIREVPRNAHAGFVYMMQAGQLFKIGCSVNPAKRVQDLRYGATAAKLLATWPTSDKYEDERRLQGRLWRHHVRGEWYRLPSRLVARLAKLSTLATVRDEWERFAFAAGARRCLATA